MNKLIFVYILLLLFCCTGEQELQTPLNHVLRDLDIELYNSDLVILIIPIYDGCASCSHKAMSFLSKNFSSNIILIMSFRQENKEKSLSYLSEYLGDKKEWTKKIYLDSNNICFKKDLIFNNPRIVLMEI